jgi:hypothetical protein
MNACLVVDGMVDLGLSRSQSSGTGLAMQLPLVSIVMPGLYGVMGRTGWVA